MRSSFIFALLLVLCIMFTSVYARRDPIKHSGKKGVSGNHHDSKSGVDSGKKEVTSTPARRRRKRNAITGLISTATGAAAPATNMLGGVTGLLGGGNAKPASLPKPEASS